MFFENRFVWFIAAAVVVAIGVLFFLFNPISAKEGFVLPNEKVVAFGDSLTLGYGVSESKSYPSVLRDITGYNIYNEGLNGDRAKAAKQRLIDAIEYHNPALVLLAIGGNDMLINQEETLKEDLIDLVNTVLSRGVRVVLIGQPRPSLGRLKDAAVYKEVAKETGVLYVKGLFSKYLYDDEYKSDAIHLNEKGYERFAQDLAKELKSKGIFYY